MIGTAHLLTRGGFGHAVCHMADKKDAAAVRDGGEETPGELVLACEHRVLPKLTSECSQGDCLGASVGR